MQKRVAIDIIVIETPALLNLVKHCQDKKELMAQSGQSSELAVGARGSIMGVLKNELGSNNLVITSTLPGKKIVKDIAQIQNEAKAESKKELLNEIGFYVSS